MDIPRHKVFISYYHQDDQYYKNRLISMKEVNQNGVLQSIFDDYSVHEDEIDDTDLSSEQIRRIIRDEYIKNATVLILLCGKNTKRRKHIDWEIHAAMFHTENNPRMGIVVINLPTIKQSIRAGSPEEKTLLSGSGERRTLETRSDFESHYPYMPSRIIDNFVKEVPITVAEWTRIENNPQILKRLIDNAFKRKDNISYDYSVPLRRQNS
ncbi:MAG: TIR domain-containing protein [Candidatus Treponema excrementipullorum]|nr:TIR domain-containing protein [Candidatus Treponema excrementipullorum]